MAIVALFGLLVIGVLSHYKVKGSVIIGIISTTILAIPLEVANTQVLTGNFGKIYLVSLVETTQYSYHYLKVDLLFPQMLFLLQ